MWKWCFFGEHVDGLLTKCTLWFKLEIILRFEDFLNDLDLWLYAKHLCDLANTGQKQLEDLWSVFENGLGSLSLPFSSNADRCRVCILAFLFFQVHFILLSFHWATVIYFPLFNFPFSQVFVKLVWKRCWSLTNQIPPHDFRGISKVSLFGTQFPSCIITLLQTFRKETKGGAGGQILYWKYWKNNNFGRISHFKCELLEFSSNKQFLQQLKIAPI